VRLYCGDCLQIMPTIEAGSVDLILCDLPYGITACKWDSVIPFEPLWAEYRRLIKPNGAIVLTASQPFTSALVMSNPRMFRYSLVWDKVNRVTGGLNANRMPLRRHEDVLVFYEKLPTYNPQWQLRKPVSGGRRGGQDHQDKNIPRVKRNLAHILSRLLPFQHNVTARHCTPPKSPLH